MSTTTPVHNLPYPEATDAPFVHLDIRALALAAEQELVEHDALMFVAAASAPAHLPGRRWLNTTTKTTYVSDGSQWLFVSNPTQVCHLRRAAALALPSGDTSIAWDTEVKDPAAMHTGSATTVTIPEAGRYTVKGRAGINPMTGGVAFLRIVHNPSGSYLGPVMPQLGAGSGLFLYCEVELDMAAGDTVSLLLTQTSGAANSLQVGAVDNSFVVRRVG